MEGVTSQKKQTKEDEHVAHVSLNGQPSKGMGISFQQTVIRLSFYQQFSTLIASLNFSLTKHVIALMSLQI